MRKNTNRFQAIFSLFFLFLSFQIWAQYDIPPKPTKQTAVYDQAQILNSTEKSRLEQKLIAYADTTSTQIVVITIPSLKGEYIGMLAAEWGEKWEIGQSQKDNGILMLAAMDDREFWITTGYGVEPFMTDAESSLVYNRIIKPEFQNENYYKGLDEGTTAIIKILEGEFESLPKKNTDDHDFFTSLIILFFIVTFVIYLLSKANKGSGKGGGGRKSNSDWLFDAIILSNLGRGGGSSYGGSSGGSFGGGGFSGGFGGGRFGGGGAGGSW